MHNGYSKVTICKTIICIKWSHCRKKKNSNKAEEMAQIKNSNMLFHLLI